MTTPPSNTQPLKPPKKHQKPLLPRPTSSKEPRLEPADLGLVAKSLVALTSTAQPQKTSPVIDFGILLGLAYQALIDALNVALKAEGFTDIGRHYGYVFRALDADALHLRQLAERLGMTDQGAGKIVDDMVANGYVERYPDLVDGRVKKLRLSARGQAALATARRFHHAYEADLALRLPHGNVLMARSVLEALLASNGADSVHASLRVIPSVAGRRTLRE
jgi:DNA-binding MarR family transcriptional regulator